jgi:hypothetical protein
VPSPGGLPPAGAGGPVGRFDFTADPLPFFGWAILLVICTLLVIPYPFALAAFMEWLGRHVHVEGRPEFRFVGRAADIWLPTIAAALGGWFGIVVTSGGLILISVLLNAVIAWWVVRTLISFFERNGSRLRFDGSVFAYIGWQLLITVSFITIIGWAWATAAMYGWIAENVRNAGGDLEFVGPGHEILWRVIVAVLASIFIIPIPWVWWWVYRWVIQQVRVKEVSASFAPAGAYAS